MSAVPSERAPVFYTLPVEQVVPGMSTSDGQDFLDAPVGETAAGGLLWAHVYTPAIDKVIDSDRRAAPEARGYTAGSRVSLAVFGDTKIDGSSWPDAQPDPAGR